jgi:hypothetical protein
MSLPDFEKAFIPKQKISDYLLSETHAVGKAKARYFRSIGYTEKHADQLTEDLLMIAKSEKVIGEIISPYGTKYLIDGEMATPLGIKARLRTVWVVESHDKRPRFVTAYPA